MASLQHRDGQTLSELAEHISIDLSTLSRVVANMQGQDLLKREKNGADKRSVRLHLSGHGKKLVAQLVPPAELYERIALAGVSNDEISTLKRVLERVYLNLAAVRAVPRTRRES